MNSWKKYVLYYTFCIVGIISCFFIRDKYFVWFIVYSILLGPTFYVFEQIRKEDNIFVYYLIKGPLFLMFLLLVFIWFFFPVFYYFSTPSSIYYTLCLKLLGGEIGEGIWIMVYLFGWGYIGWKMFDKIEEVIVKFINKFKKK
jgi:hypothetical protein